MDPIQAVTAILSQPIIAAYGPWGAVALLMGFMLYSWLRGRENRMATLDAAYAAALREDQRELFERQSAEIEGLKVDKKVLEARLQETQNLTTAQRACLFDYYQHWRTAYHAAANAQQLLISAGLRKLEEFEPLTKPEPPHAHSQAAE